MSKEYRPRLNQSEWNLVQRFRKINSFLCKLISKLTFGKCCDKDCKK